YARAPIEERRASSRGEAKPKARSAADAVKASSAAKTHHTDPSGPRLHLFRSNRMERLVDAIAGLLAEPTEDAFAPECLLVSGRGMAHWLSLELSRRYGIWS